MIDWADSISDGKSLHTVSSQGSIFTVFILSVNVMVSVLVIIIIITCFIRCCMLLALNVLCLETSQFKDTWRLTRHITHDSLSHNYQLVNVQWFCHLIHFGHIHQLVLADDRKWTKCVRGVRMDLIPSAVMGSLQTLSRLKSVFWLSWSWRLLPRSWYLLS